MQAMPALDDAGVTYYNPQVTPNVGPHVNHLRSRHFLHPDRSIHGVLGLEFLISSRPVAYQSLVAIPSL